MPTHDIIDNRNEKLIDHINFQRSFAVKLCSKPQNRIDKAALGKGGTAVYTSPQLAPFTPRLIEEEKSLQEGRL